MLPTSEQLKSVAECKRNIGGVTAYSSSLSAHGPYWNHPVPLRDEGCRNGTTLLPEQLRTSALGASALTEHRVLTSGAHRGSTASIGGTWG